LLSPFEVNFNIPKHYPLANLKPVFGR